MASCSKDIQSYYIDCGHIQVHHGKFTQETDRQNNRLSHCSFGVYARYIYRTVWFGEEKDWCIGALYTRIEEIFYLHYMFCIYIVFTVI